MGAKPQGGYEVQREACYVFQRAGEKPQFYNVKGGRVSRSTLSVPPAAAADRLYLVNVSGLGVFRPIYDALSGTGFYNLNPDAIRDLQPPDPGDLLKRDGSNAASVLANLGSRSPAFKKRMEGYLEKVARRCLTRGARVRRCRPQGVLARAAPRLPHRGGCTSITAPWQRWRGSSCGTARSRPVAEGSRWTFVGDVKYKRIDDGVPNADLYQLLAYATALDLPGGLLIYAQGEQEPATHTVRHSGRRLEVAALDLSGALEGTLARVRDLAQRVRGCAAGNVSPRVSRASFVEQPS